MGVIAREHNTCVSMAAPLEPEQYFERICRTITGQQLSVKAAATIWGRVEKLVRVRGELLSATDFAAVSDDELRAAGLSFQKIGYIRSIVSSIETGEVDLALLEDMSDKEVVAELTKLKGLGVWSAEMFLMSALARPDVFSVGDLGLVTAVEKHYGIDRKDKPAITVQMEKLSPYRTTASLLLWHSLDNEST